MSFLISYPYISSHYVNFFLDESWQIVIDHFSQTKQGMFRPPNDDTFSNVLTCDISGSESPPKESGWPQKHQDFISLLGSDGHPDQTAMVIAMVAESDLEQWSSSWSADADQRHLDVLVTDHCHWVGIVCIKLGWDFYVFCGLS